MDESPNTQPHSSKTKKNKSSKEIKRKLSDKFSNLFTNILQNHDGKLSLYKTIKHNLKLEKYLSITNTEHRKALTRFRTSSHNLPIERGRYSNIVRNNRLCHLCNLGNVGDEYHATMICNKKELCIIRKQFMENCCKVNDQFASFNKLSMFQYAITCADDNISDLFAKFVYDVLKIYDQHVA